MMTIALLLLLAQTTAPPQTTSAAAGTYDDYNIGVADVIDVRVFGEPEASRLGAIVDNDGTIDMPLIGRVKVAGKTARTIEKEIRDRMDKFFVNPSINVEIVKYRSKSVMVQGYVRDPGEKTLEGNASLTRVLAQAGSISLDAASYVMINRRGPDGAIVQTRVTRKQIESGEAQNILLQDGDTVVVPKAETIYINGNVRSPGNVAWEEGMTIERALTAAGGTTDRAGKIEIVRGTKTITKNAKRSDLVQAGDIVRVKQRFF